jgi:hypothetical protein
MLRHPQQQGLRQKRHKQQQKRRAMQADGLAVKHILQELLFGRRLVIFRIAQTLTPAEQLTQAFQQAGQ